MLPHYGRSIYKNERLPPHQLASKKNSERCGLITTKKICSVKVFTISANNLSSAVVRSVDDIQNLAVKEQPSSRDSFYAPGVRKVSGAHEAHLGKYFETLIAVKLPSIFFKND